MNKKLGLMVGALFALTAAQSAMAACSDVSRAALQQAADDAYSAGDQGGFHLPMWVTMVDETGKVCHVVTTGATGAAAGNTEWLGSRIISAQKANTANAFSLDGVSISTGALYGPTQSGGGSLYGLQHSNPIDASRAYGGSPNTYGTNSDYLKNKRIGGVNVFGGGLALYKSAGEGYTKVGAIGVSGDTSCADHSFAWQVKQFLTSTSNANEWGPGGFEYLIPWAGTFSLGEHPVCGGPNGTSGIGWD